ncbi:hypothetical protein AKJ16_DCAP11375 [Drosera capensis]
MASKSKNSKAKELMFDPRYGWVIDERREPIDEALSGGRGTFGVVPLAKGLYSMVCPSIWAAVNTAVELFNNPDSLSLPHLQAKMQDQFNNFSNHVKIPDWKSLMLKGQSLSLPAIGPWLFQTESSDPHTRSWSTVSYMSL